jgi:hypothetical protein
MDATRRLLQAEQGSEIAMIARSGLIAWRAMLKDAVQRCPGDPGFASAVDLIHQLDELLGEPSADGGKWPAGHVPGPAGGSGLNIPDSRLAGLVAEFTTDPVVKHSIDEQSLDGLHSANDADDMWRGLHLSLLRLPEQAAARWRASLATLAAAPQTESPGWHTLPGESEAVLVPLRAAVTASGSPPPAGYRTSPQAPADEEVCHALGFRSAVTAGPDADEAELARLGSLLLSLTELDENLVVCLESTLYQGSRRLDDELRQRYHEDLLGRLREYSRSAPGSVPRFEALLDIDEAVNSLMHRPPPPPDSWWAQVRQQSRRMVDRSAGALRKAGADIEVMPLSLRYRDVRDLTNNNDVASRSGGEPGDVLACLRLWARVEGKTLPGRVMYRT